MRKEEAELRAKVAANNGCMLEAAWISVMLSGAPDTLTRAQMMVVHVAFYRGAESLLQILDMVAREKDPRLNRNIRGHLQQEINAFFRAMNTIGKEMLEKKGKEEQAVKH